MIASRIFLLAGLFAAHQSAFAEASTCPADHIAQGNQPPAGLEWKCTTKAGVVDGLWRTWYNDRQLLSERQMKLGKEHGRQRMWWPNGQLMMEGVSVDGHRYQGFKYWAADGTPTQLEIKTETVMQPLVPGAAKPINGHQ
ncbi:MAG TPA: hypothetical protein VLC91_10925 [Spongiibacteraceae bacterium]|nr:hypothetical protein [Spongiibacteraceae bacterium]